MATRLTGAPVAKEIYAQVREKAVALGTQPCLAAVSVGAQPDDRAYLRSIARSADGCGVAVRPVELPADCAADALTGTLRALSADDTVHGVLLLRPLPAALRAQEILDTLDARKDVDGMTTWSLGALVTGAAGFAPCTAEACMELLRAHGIDPAGSRAVVIGRSLVIGRPVAMMLLQRSATVTICHSRTEDMPRLCREAKILVAAAGQAGLVKENFVGPDQVILDVGINVDENGTLCGDVAFEAVEPEVSAITPVPGGVGGVTTAVLAAHVVDAAERAAGV